MSVPERLIEPAMLEHLEEVARLCRTVRGDRAGIRHVLNSSDGPQRVDHLIRLMRESSAELAKVTREMTRTADVLVGARRRWRIGVRA